MIQPIERPVPIATPTKSQAARLQLYIRDLIGLLDSELKAHCEAHRQKIALAIEKWAVSKLPPKTAVPARPRAAIPRQPTKPPEQSAVRLADACRIADSLAMARQIIGNAETHDLPQAAWEFAESVSEKARGIMATIEATRVVSNKQEEALENMAAGLARWMRE